MKAFMLSLTLMSCYVAVLCADESDDDGYSRTEMDVDFGMVTCGSTIKLQHSSSGYRLHSHDIKLGSGSQQQSVTAVSMNDDQNSLWLIKGRDSRIVCPRGTPVKHGQQIRLMHLKTQNHLHTYSQHHAALSHQREVAAPPDGGAWELVTMDGGVWKRGQNVLLKHAETGGYLLARSEWDYNEGNCGQQCPIAGHLEVSTTADADRYRNLVQWKTAEGLYWPKGRKAGTEVHVDEERSTGGGGKQGIPEDSEMKEIKEFMKGTQWYWNNWRNVEFLADGKFMAPTDDCKRGECSWKVGPGGEIVIEWGEAGRHSIRASSDRQTISGHRTKDKEACTGTFVGNV